MNLLYGPSIKINRKSKLKKLTPLQQWRIPFRVIEASLGKDDVLLYGNDSLSLPGSGFTKKVEPTSSVFAGTDCLTLTSPEKTILASPDNSSFQEVDMSDMRLAARARSGGVLWGIDYSDRPRYFTGDSWNPLREMGRSSLDFLPGESGVSLALSQELGHMDWADKFPGFARGVIFLRSEQPGLTSNGFLTDAAENPWVAFADEIFFLKDGDLFSHSMSITEDSQRLLSDVLTFSTWRKTLIVMHEEGEVLFLDSSLQAKYYLPVPEKLMQPKIKVNDNGVLVYGSLASGDSAIYHSQMPTRGYPFD